MKSRKYTVLACLLFLGLEIFSFGSIEAQSVFDNFKVHQQLEEQSPYTGLHWVSIGPSFMGSRVETIEVPNNNPSVIYVGFGSGGLWKTENQGLSWKNIFANEASFSIGDLAISSQDSETLWLGTGEQLRASRGFSYPGSGIYKSEDGGNTWKHKGLSDSHHIGRVIIDPYDSNKVYVAAMGHFWSKNSERGLFYTDNGGDTWQNILYISDSIGITDVIWDANNKIIYASSWQIPDGKESKIYRSKDEGKTWTVLDLPTFGGDKIGRIGLGHSPSNPESVYAVLDNRNPLGSLESEQRGEEVFHSSDFGDTWRKTHFDQLVNYGGFGWAFGDIIPHPIKTNEIFILGVHLLRSTDGGKNFKRVSGEIQHLRQNKGTQLHLDQHEFKIIPGEKDTWVLGNDGGVFISWDEGKTWLHTNTIPTGEFHDVYATGNKLVQIYGGTQDNSNIYGTINPYNYKNPTLNWDYVWLDPWSGGDGFTCLPDPSDPDWVYWESQNGYLNKKNLKTRENIYIKPKADKDESPLRNSWFTPFIQSSFNQQTLYYAANKVYKTINGGESWFRASHDLTFSEDTLKKSRSITCIAESRVRAGVIYAATEKGAVWVSRNDGTKWFEVSSSLPVKKVVGIYPSNYDAARVYLVARGMDDDDPTPYVFTSDNYGNRWKNISSNLPYIPVNCIVEDPLAEDIIYIGTDAGVYCTGDRGDNWNSISSQLPTATIHQLRLMADNDFLLAASHGQGLFYCNLQGIRRFSRSGYTEEAQFLSSIEGIYPGTKDYNKDWDYSSLQEAVISWYSPEKIETQIDLYHESGDFLFSYELESTRGLNQFFWDLIVKKEEDKTNYPLPEISFPKTGTYDVKIILGSKTIDGQVIIKK